MHARTHNGFHASVLQNEIPKEQVAVMRRHS